MLQIFLVLRLGQWRDWNSFLQKFVGVLGYSNVIDDDTRGRS
jgi:hypothetical protein